MIILFYNLKTHDIYGIVIWNKFDLQNNIIHIETTKK